MGVLRIFYRQQDEHRGHGDDDESGPIVEEFDLDFVPVMVNLDAAHPTGWLVPPDDLNALADVPNTDPAQAARLRDGEASRIRIAQLCK